MATISFVIPGKMGGKGRTRTVATGDGRLKSYTPERTRSLEAVIRDLAAQQMKNVPIFVGPVEVFINVWRLVPPSWPKKRREEAKWMVGKPDADNILKILTDAMNAIVFRDDAQIAVAHIQRRWSLAKEEVYVLVRTLENGSLVEPAARPSIPGSPALAVDNGTGAKRQTPVVERNDVGGDRAEAPSAGPKDRQSQGVS